MAAKIRVPEGMMNANMNRGDGGSAAMPPQRSAPAPIPASAQQEEEEPAAYSKEELQQWGIQCAILSKWDTVLRLLYLEKRNTEGAEVIANTIFEIMVHFGFEQPPEISEQKEAA